jgi:hypothetical protein
MSTENPRTDADFLADSDDMDDASRSAPAQRAWKVRGVEMSKRWPTDAELQASGEAQIAAAAQREKQFAILANRAPFERIRALETALKMALAHWSAATDAIRSKARLQFVHHAADAEAQEYQRCRKVLESK